MRNTHLALALVGIIGCNGKDEDSSAAMNIEPTEGTWNWSGASYALDDCSLESSFPPAFLEALEWNLTLQEGGFIVETATFDDPLDCTVTGMDYSCPVTLEAEVSEWPEGSGQTGDPDVSTVSTGSVSGTFSDEVSASAAFAFTVVCSGADCDAYGAAAGVTSPCDSRIEGDFLLNQG
jgi:hypothetical protein